MDFSMCVETRELRFTVPTVDCGRGNLLAVVDLVRELDVKPFVS